MKIKSYTRFLGMVKVPVLIGAIIFSQAVLVIPAFAASYLTLDSFSGKPGVTLTASGGGWTPTDTLKIFLKDTSGFPAASATIAADGSFSASIPIPANTPQGSLSIIAVDATNNQQSTNSYYVIPLLPEITVTAPSQSPYSTITIDGTGFAANEGVTLSLAGATSQAQADASGSFTGATLVVPAVTPGLYNVRGTGNLSGAPTRDYLHFFWIDALYPTVTPSAYYLLPGQTLSFTGSGFAANESISVTESGSSNVLSTFTANASGSFSAAGGFALPASLHGKSTTFVLTGAISKATASTGMTIGDFYAYASPSAYWVLPGASVSFSGGGFAANETVSIYKNTESTPVTTITTNSQGGFTGVGTVAVPYDAANGSVNYKLVGSTSNASASVGVAVGSFYPSISPSSYYVEGNSTITISGTGFAPNETVSLSVNNNASSTTSVTANTQGAISAQVLIPFTTKSSSTISAAGQTSHGNTSVDVTMATYYPSITPSSYYVFPGQNVSFSGSGFVPNEQVLVTFSTNTPGPRSLPPTMVVANAQGSFVTSAMTIPYSNEQTVSATFSGSLSNNPVTSTITVGTLSAFLTSDSYNANPGGVIHVVGHGFGANEQVGVSVGTGTTSTQFVTSDTTGVTAPAALSVPFNSGPNLHIVFSGVLSNVISSLDIPVGSFYPTLTADNYFASPGSLIHISATGFAPHEVLALTAGTAFASSTTNAFGSATIPVTLPFGNQSGITIHVVGQTSGSAADVVISFAPTSATVAPSTYYTSPGSTITFSGTGYVPNEIISVTLSSNSLGTITASSTGAFTYSTQIPLNTSGTAHFVFNAGTSMSSQSLDITLAQFYAGIQLSTYYAQGGTALTISGNGFGPNEQIILTAAPSTGSNSSSGTAAISVGSSTADASGSFTFSGKVPFAPAGKTTITAKGGSTNAAASTDMTIAPVYTSLQLGAYAGAPGSSVTFIGSGYLGNEPISVTTDRTSASSTSSSSGISYTFNADASGNFNNSGFTIPSDMAEGNLVFTVSGSHSFDTKTITYYVTGR